MRSRCITLGLMFMFLGGVCLADEVDDGIAGLEKALKEKAKGDIQHFIKLLGDKFATSKPEQQKEIIRLSAVAIGTADADTRDACLEALAKMDSRAVPALIKELDKKTTEDNVPYMSAVVKAIGRLKDPKDGLTRLKKLVYYKSNDVIAAAIDGMSNYKESPLETKKEIVNLILQVWGSAESGARKPTDTAARAKRDRIKGPAEESIRSLTGQNIQGGVEAWQKWYSETGKKATKW